MAPGASRRICPGGDIMDETSSAPAHPSKKCPYCNIYLEINAKRCYSCKRRVGRANRVGIARKPLDWLAYLICILSWAAFGFYVWWAFLRK